MGNYLIGISGRKQSGKDLAYQVINSSLMSSTVAVRRYAFADNVKRYASEYFGYPKSEDDKETYRFILQGIGQMMRDEISRDFWINKVMEQIAEANVEFKNKGISHVAVITDIRYLNEVEAVTALGTLLRIDRPSLQREDTHPSETELDDYPFDNIIVNDGDKNLYISKVRTWTNIWKNSVSL